MLCSDGRKATRARRKKGDFMRTNLFLGTALLAIGLPMMAVAADAPTTDQSAKASEVGAVTITARKHAERDLDVPIATTEIGKVELQQQGAKDFEQIVALIPSA